MASPDPIAPENLPEQSLLLGLPRRAVILGLVVMAFFAFFIPLYLISTGVRKDNARLESRYQAANTTLTAVHAPAPDAQDMQAELTRLRQSADEMQQAYDSIVHGRTDWPLIMAAINSYDPAQMAITSLSQAGNRITVNGLAGSDAVVVAYVRALEAANLFSRVTIQSMRSLATPFATPTGPGGSSPDATPTSATPMTPTLTATPTAEAGDSFETDDFQPVDIILGLPQLRNFYPVYDVDQVKFLAKNGRLYRVFTFDLAPGVDTFLTVSVAGATYTNDDFQAGDLSSEVVFEVQAGRDVEARVKITNRGQYGPDMRYQIAVEEAFPTPTPTTTQTPVPTLTSTPPPTVQPTATPTPTPDLRDVYEPDDSPRSIAVGETQPHNFYPTNDVDRLKFLAKAGRFYRVITSGLATGVDTLLTVNVGGVIHTNDDRWPGDLSSLIEFQAPLSGDVDALVEVSNRDQFGPDKSYQITVEEYVPTPGPTFTPTPTPTATVTPTDTAAPTLTPTPTATATATAASSSRLPGLAAVRFSSAQESVEFVLLLELKAESP